MQPTVTRTVPLNGARPDFVHKKLRVWLENRFGIVGSSKKNGLSLTVKDAALDVDYGCQVDATLFSLAAAVTDEVLTLTATDMRQVIAGMGTYLVCVEERLCKFEKAIDTFIADLMPCIE